jgi:two-component system OmpR family sensor kinase
MTEPTTGPVIELPDPLPAAEPKRRTGWFSRNPLRVKLVGAILLLVALALGVIGTASAYVLRQYLVDRVDSQLYGFAQGVVAANMNASNNGSATVFLPSEYVFGIPDGKGGWGLRTSSGDWGPPYSDRTLSPQDLPVVSTTPQSITNHLGQPFTAVAQDGRMRWRVLIANVQNQPFVVAHSLSTVDSTVDRLVLVELTFGGAVLIALAMVGAWLVRASLMPLTAIERTAAAIARGDLTQRVPELDPHTELGSLSAALNTMLTQIETAFKARAASEARAVSSEERMRQFVADASHELRTPLTTIRGFAELYRQGAAPDPADVLRRIEDEAARMGLLVEDLLLLARLDEERPMQFEPVHVAEVILDAAAAARAVAPERPVTVDIGDHAELTVTGDEPRLRQVVGNLVTNALTHTPPGTPIAVRLRVEDPSLAVVEVSDEGPGLSEEHARRVFERFYRVDKARTRGAVTPYDSSGTSVAHNGSGLGLAIVAALVAAHRGTVEVQTAPGRGATFRVRLPIDVA